MALLEVAGYIPDVGEENLLFANVAFRHAGHALLTQPEVEDLRTQVYMMAYIHRGIQSWYQGYIF